MLNCDLYGLCEETCPNQVKVGSLMQEIVQLTKKKVDPPLLKYRIRQRIK